ncbi:MAG: hypothetical protein A3K19_16885 [Lentisphaerae bacterium RIFOXYB12_FULL_65_16]|nr:MAG: hypothetical protein A3K18_17845 [Lentisphaerae bacterium RIFOXYA12_64_32]OGV88923.1 MAG: hypothetical protein A3K19_16885 [Lentisphaerae bacterium RIFOXYB12_FULL_65_16]
MRSVFAIGWGFLVLALLTGGCSPVDPEVALQQAATAMNTGKWKEAVALTQRCLRTSPADAKLKIMHGVSLLEAERKDDALDMLEEAVLQAPDDFSAQYFYGLALVECARFGDAMVPLRKAYEQREAHPEVAPDVLILLSRCCLEQNLDEGIRYLLQLRSYRAFNRRPEVYNALGILYLNRREYNNARQSFLMAMSKDRENPAVLQNLAVLYDQHLRDPAEAMRYYRAALRGKQLASDSTGQDEIRQRLKDLARERAVQAPDDTPPTGTQPDDAPAVPAPPRKPAPTLPKKGA